MAQTLQGHCTCGVIAWVHRRTHFQRPKLINAPLSRDNGLCEIGQ